MKNESEQELINRRGFLKISATLAVTPWANAFQKIIGPPNIEIPDEKEYLAFDPSQKIPVLEYHNPNYGCNEKGCGPVYMTEEMFRSQIHIIKKNGFITPSKNDLLDWVDKKRGLPPKSVILRIDVGVPYKDYESQFKLLEAKGLSAIGFFLSGSINDESTGKTVGWDVIKKFVKKGVLIPGSHGINHPDYQEISQEQAVWDAVNSKKEIEKKLEEDVHFFAYPFDSAAHEKALLRHFKMLFGHYNKMGVEASNTEIAGTYYPYAQEKRKYDPKKFESDLLNYVNYYDKLK